MAQPIGENLIFGRSRSVSPRNVSNVSLPAFAHRSLAVCVSALFLLEAGVQSIAPSLAVTPDSAAVKMAQQPETTSPDVNRAAAERAFAQGQELFKQGTAESRRQAIEKYEEALKLWRTVGASEAPPKEARSQEAQTLDSIGLTYYSLGEKQKTLDYYNQALLLRRALKNPSGEAIALLSIAGVYSDLGEKQKALDFYNQALPLFRSVGARPLEALTLTSIASVYSDLGDQQSSLNFFNQALALQRDLKDTSAEADTLLTLSRIYLSLGETQKAFNSLNQALPLFRAVNDKGGEAQTLTLLGVGYYSLGESQKALDLFNQALPLFRAGSDSQLLGNSYTSRFGEALTLQTLGGVYNSLGEPQKALDSFKGALTIHRSLGNPGAEGEILNSIGSVYDSLGEPQKALDSFNQALKLQQAVGEPTKVAFTLNNIGGIYNSLGEKQKALDSYNQALKLQRGASDRAGEAVTLTYIALVYKSLGDYQLSLDSYNQALSLFRSVGDRFREAQTLDNIGGVYRLSEDYQKALDSSSQALSLWRTESNRFGEATTLTTIVRIYESMGDYPKALDSSTQARQLFSAMKNRSGEAAAIGLTGRAYKAMGDYQKALDSFNQSLPLFRAVGSRFGEATALDKIGSVYDSLGQHQQAINSYNQALSLWRVTGDRASEAETLYNIADVERDRGNLQGALTQIEATLKIIESLRTKVASQELRASYFASVQKYYQLYTDLLMQLHKNNPSQGYDGKALQASERARARTLLEILTEAGADIRQGVDPKLLERDRTLQQQINAKAERQQQLIAANNEAQATAIKTEIDALSRQYQEVQAQIRATSPRYAALTQPQPLTLSEIQQQVLDDNTLLLEYSLGEERSYLWAVTKTGITSYELPKRADIEAAARRFRDSLTVPWLRTSPAKVAEASAALSQLLLQPVASQLGQKRLLIVADGALQYVPFTALSVPGTPTQGGANVPLVRQHEIITLPSASTLAVLRHELAGRKPAAKTVAVLADPVFTSSDERVKGKPSPTSNSQLLTSQLDRSARESGVKFKRLPFTRQEAEQILALAPPAEREQALNFAANRATATSPQLSQYRIVHFATHGILNSSHPELSGVVLSLVDEKGTPQNGFLRLQDVFNLKLPAELIVLSACQTGLGQDIKGEGLVGLTRGFMYAGAPRVVVSLWSVDDQATAELMTRFYRGMLKEGKRPAAALRAAQVEMSQHPQWNSPYYWAGFALQGEWR
ncbi:MAG: tetratricopeptide repeat protein [Aphanothece sp. CMT-3BRIN-NPC111]|jgi:CHAT domain-containing protein/tetratricopeptide (TPR) repeat protein|nr:tetratricopeptide repeat protein [Aphanothece sp. CMT-3BRIN-NPC111]